MAKAAIISWSATGKAGAMGTCTQMDMHEMPYKVGCVGHGRQFAGF